KESEDERIKSAVIEFIRQNRSFNYSLGVSKEEAIAWIEKQGEQKPEIEYIYPRFRIGDVIEPIKPNGFHRPVRVLSIEGKTKSYYCESDDKKHFSSIPIRCEDEYKLVEQNSSWSEEDKTMIDNIIWGVHMKSIKPLDEMDDISKYKKYEDFLKSLPKRFNLHPNQEWSVEDEKMISLLIKIFEVNHPNEHFKVNPIGTINMEAISTKEIVDWLKSIKPQSYWKPSEE
ncbi:MAG: hypothetical protein J6X18_06560, partial [Bacteroidales bacterium]|nr:hypothetical protein [Bacteroidales bacterium]